MNKKLSIIVITSLVMALVSCKSNETQITDVYKENVFSYNIEKCCAFTVENEILYASFPEENAIKSFDSSGTLLDTYVMNEGVHTNLSYYNNKLYCFTYGDDANYITVYDIEKNSLESHKVDMDILSTLSMTVANDNIYMVYWSEHIDEYLESVKYSDDDTYIYMGEKAVEIDTTDYSVNDVNIDNVLNLKPYSKNEIIYYAYDDTGGYYTIIYNVDK